MWYKVIINDLISRLIDDDRAQRSKCKRRITLNSISAYFRGMYLQYTQVRYLCIYTRYIR